MKEDRSSEELMKGVGEGIQDTDMEKDNEQAEGNGTYFKRTKGIGVHSARIKGIGKLRSREDSQTG
jgi:hypothetical protein